GVRARLQSEALSDQAHLRRRTPRGVPTVRSGSAQRRKARASLELRARQSSQIPVQQPRGPRRLVEVELLPRIANEQAHVAPVTLRVVCGKRCERTLVARQQLVAHPFRLVLLRNLGDLRLELPGQRGPDRGDIVF